MEQAAQVAQTVQVAQVELLELRVHLAKMVISAAHHLSIILIRQQLTLILDQAILHLINRLRIHQQE
jgi:hypothetical protein